MEIELMLMELVFTVPTPPTILGTHRPGQGTGRDIGPGQRGAGGGLHREPASKPRRTNSTDTDIYIFTLTVKLQE